jgi:hypothetical protein
MILLYVLDGEKKGEGCPSPFFKNADLTADRGFFSRSNNPCAFE